jgi:F-type H+-transporting ATPase subunit alpha
MQQLNPSEISDIIKHRIEGLDVRAQAQNEGTIVGVSDGIVRIDRRPVRNGDEP